MAKRSRKRVETLLHEEASRRNIPTAEHEPVMAEDERSPVEVAYERRNRDLDPQLVWRGKDEQNWSDLVVQAPPLFIQEKVHPKALINDLLRHSKTAEAERLARRRGSRSTCSPTSTACRATTPAPSSTSTTPTGRTA